MKKAFTLIELLIVVAIIAILAAIAVPNFLEAQVRSKVSRVRSDIRSLATGIESYYVDNNQYPTAARTGALRAGVDNVNGYVVNTNAALKGTWSFSAQQNAAPRVASLTSPISYITSYFGDPFQDVKSATFGYYADTNGWICWSPGPDTDGNAVTASYGTNLGVAYAVETVYDSRISQPSTTLIAGANATASPNNGAYSYDPTNGTVSQGDVWRVKQ